MMHYSTHEVIDRIRVEELVKVGITNLPCFAANLFYQDV